MKEFAKRIGKSVSYSSKILRKFEKQGIIELRRVGKRKIIKFRSPTFRSFNGIQCKKIFYLSAFPQ